jgi:AcrR family transcriptional regulator
VTPPPGPRRSAAERREEIIAIAIGHFGRSGYYGASTEGMARDAGISQPYLFRLFGTKRDLFLACVDEVYGRIRGAFERAVLGPSDKTPLDRMGLAYYELLPDRAMLMFQLQSHATTDDPEIQAHVRRAYGELVAAVARISGASDQAVFDFFAHGMLINVIASLDLASVARTDPWAAAWCQPHALMAISAEGGGVQGAGAP